MEAQQFKTQREVLDDASGSYPAEVTRGVVFVHGVGSQQRSMPLREQADPLIDWLRRWHEANDVKGFAVVSSALSYGVQLEGPARVRVHIPPYRLSPERRALSERAIADRAEETKEEQAPDDRPDKFGGQNWVMTEAYWAGHLAAPSFKEMIGWARQAYSLAIERLWRLQTERSLRSSEPIVIHRTGRRDQAALRSGLAVGIEAFSGFLVAGLYLVAGVLLIPFLLVLFLIAQLPIPAVEEFILIRLLRPLLVEGVGDFYTYLHDDVQALHMRRSVEEAVHWLVKEEGCHEVIVVSHSGGALLAHDALGTRTGDAEFCYHEVPELENVSALVTVGAGLNNAWTPGFGPDPARRLTDPLCKHTYWVDAWAAYDPVCGDAIEDPHARGPWHDKPREEIKMTNGLNVITDHGSYWTNEEQYAPRIAQLVESPGSRHESRFWDPVRTEWSERRRDRVTTLVAWRDIALFAFGGAVVARWLDGRIAREGSAALEIAAQLPVIGGFVSGVMQAASSVPQLVQLAGATATGVAVWAIVAVVAYMVIIRPVYEPWARRDGRASIAPVVAPKSQWGTIAVFTLAVLAAIGVVAYGIVTVSLNEITFWSAANILFAALIWITVWSTAVPKIQGPHPYRATAAQPATQTA